MTLLLGSYTRVRVNSGWIVWDVSECIKLFAAENKFRFAHTM